MALRAFGRVFRLCCGAPFVALLTWVAVTGLPQVAAGSGGPTGRSASVRAADRCPGALLGCAQLVELGLTYPYRRERGSYLFVDGAAFPYVRITPRLLGDSLVAVHGDTMTAAALIGLLGVPRPQGGLTPTLAYGANANVDALTRKYEPPTRPMHAVIPVIKGRLSAYDVTWSPQLVFNGAMPSTLVPSPGTLVSTWITWLGARELRRMNATEGVGSLYSVGRLRGVHLRAPGPRIADPLVYEDCRGSLRIGNETPAVAGVPAERRRFPALTSPAALRQVAPTFGWGASATALVVDNVRHPARRRARDRVLATLAAAVPDPHYRPSVTCAHAAGS
jgi:hypothetical protein